jgi:hypothetical protein
MNPIRMENAMLLAETCWEKAMEQNPEFVERYLELAEELLTSKNQVTGDEFREYCASNGLGRPSNLHPNVWVSGVRALKTIGWISPMGKVEPVKMHNHMPTVTLWHSKLFGSDQRGRE